MSEPITFNLGVAQDAQGRLDEGDGRVGDEQLAAILEGYNQQGWERFKEAERSAERAVWLTRQCGDCEPGGTGEVCDEHSVEPGGPGDLFDPPPVGEPTCDTCPVPESRWPVDHPLHREGSGQCAWCRQADIEDDKRYGRRINQ